MSDDNKNETTETTASENAVDDSAPEKGATESSQSGPKFTEAPGDPLAGVGTIIGIVVLMLLARCGG